MLQMCLQWKKPEVSIMFLRGDISILVPAIFRKLWLYLPRRLYFTGDQLSCISSLHQPSSSAALQAAYSSDLPSSSAISSQLPTLMSYCSVSQYMASKYIIHTVLFIDHQLWYLIACCFLTQEIEIINNWFNSLCLHWSPVIYCWLLRVETELQRDYLVGILDPNYQY